MQAQFAAAAVNPAAVRVHLIEQFFRMLPLAMGVGFVLAVLTVALLWDHGDATRQLAWLGVLALSKGARLLSWWRFRRINPADASAALEFQPLLRAGCLLGGCAWGAAVPLLYPGSDTVMQLLLTLMLAGISAGSVTSMASDRAAALLFQAPVLLPVAVHAAMAGDSVHRAIFGMVMLYAGFVAIAVLRLYRNDTENTAMRLHAIQREFDLRHSELRYRRLAHTDAMTDLPNRASLAVQLPDMLSAAQAEGTRVALFYIDVDNFKDINDSHGHGFGDQFLTDFAQRLRRGVRPQDLVVRMGGDEFVIAMQSSSENVEIEEVATRLMNSMLQPLITGTETVYSSASVGIAIYPDNGANIEELLVNADIALYAAKNRGRGQFTFYSATMSESFNERRSLEISLRQALGSKQLFVEYQPVVRIAGVVPVGLEALIRWRHPERGLLPPGVFIPIAERCGMEDLLGEHVLRAVCQQLRSWLDDMVPVVPVAINVSPRQFERGRLIDTIARVTQEYGIDPALLTIELTESALMQHAFQNLTTLNLLRELGVRVAIDDFGTGYSSLAYLKNLPIDSLKIDRSFVNDLTRDQRDSNIIRAIVAIGESLAIRVVAEGVETAEQSRALQELGCKIAQGYLYQRPMAADACTELLRRMPPQSDSSDTIPTRRLRIPDASTVS